MKKAFKISSILLLLIISISLVCYVTLVAVFHYEINSSFKEQRERLEDLRTNPYNAVQEQDFANFDLSNNDLMLNEIQFLATHNSYKAMPNMLITKPAELIGGQRVTNGIYGLPYLTDQLNMGIRGLELDIAIYKGEFILIHDPETDWRSNGPDFKLALEEIKIWSEINEGHIPINIMLQIRDVYAPFSHRFSKFTYQDVERLDNLLEEVFGQDIIKPSDILISDQDLRTSVQTNGWPLLKDCMGKVFFSALFNESMTEQDYINIDPSMATQKAFVFTRAREGVKDYSAIILADSPFADGLKDLVSNNYILRTRIDSQYSFSEKRKTAAITLGSVILTTDYPQNNTFPCGYVAKLTEDNKTIIARDSLVFD